MKQIKTAEEILEGITPYSIQGYPLLYDAVDVRNAMRIVYEQFKPECEYETIIEALKGLHKEENDKDILGFDDFNDLMKCHETQRALLVVINLLKKKLPSLPNPKQ